MAALTTNQKCVLQAFARNGSASPRELSYKLRRWYPVVRSLVRQDLVEVTSAGCYYLTAEGGKAMPEALGEEAEPYGMTRDDMVRAGLMEAEWYRDFPPPQDCFPEDGDEPRYC